MGGKGLAVAGLSMGGVGLVGSLCMASILLPSLNRAREQANRIKCASNLRQIGLAVQMYASANRGAYPASFESLLSAQYIGADVFVCPSSDDTYAAGAADLSAGGHLSYVYTGGALNFRSPPNSVVAYEPLTNHNRDGINLLHVDGTVQFIQRQFVQQKISNLKTGVNPP